jgi:hypothetical protein
MSNPFDRLEELDKKIPVTKALLEDVNSRLEALGPPPYLGPVDPAPGEGLSKDVPALTPEEQQQKSERLPNKLELYTSLSTEKERLQEELGGLEKQRSRAQRDVDTITNLEGRLEGVDGDIDKVKTERLEALQAYGDKITELKDVAPRSYDVHDVFALKELDAKVDETQGRLRDLREQRNDLVLQICDVFHGNPRDLGTPDLGSIGTATRHSNLEIGPAGELSKRTGDLDEKKHEPIIHLGKEVTDALDVTEHQVKAIWTRTGELVPSATKTQEIVGVPERPTDYMPQPSPVPDGRLAGALGVGMVCVFAKNVYQRLTQPDPEKSRAREVQELSGEYGDDMRKLGKQQMEERVALTESLQGKDEATIESRTAKQRDLHTDQINERQTEWGERFSEMWKRHEQERTPFEREKLAAPEQVQERINKWEQSDWRQYLEREQQALDR